jgi:hypothetical protein
MGRASMMRALALSLALVVVGLTADNASGTRPGEDEHDFEVTLTIEQDGPFTEGSASNEYVSTATNGGGTIRCDKLPFPGKVRPCILMSFNLTQTDLFDTEEGAVQKTYTYGFDGSKFFNIRLGDTNLVKKMPILLQSSEYCPKAKLTLVDSGQLDGMKFSGFKRGEDRCIENRDLQRTFESPESGLTITISEPVEVPPL